MNLIENLKWRYATKLFDTTKKVSDADLEEIFQAFQLTASAYGLQPWKLILVENQETRKKLQAHSWNQAQIVDASHLLVLARVENISDVHVDNYLDTLVKTRGIKREDVAGYEKMMKNNVSGKPNEEKNNWSARQLYIALGNLLTFLAAKEIDACPIEGLDPLAYNEILGLDALGLYAHIALPIGYRSENDKYAHAPKVRFDVKDLVIKM